MKTKPFLIFTACCLLTLTLTACGNGRVESTASRLGDDVSDTISRVESIFDNDDSSSGFPTESEQSSIPDYSSSQGGGINSGDNDITNGTESDYNSEAGSEIDSTYGDDNDTASDTSSDTSRRM